MKKLQFLLALIIFISVIIPVNGQFYEVSRYADDNGLPSRIVRDIFQDSKGFLWVAGNNGLYKFDGQKFHPFYSVLKDTTGLRDNKITAIVETYDGKIWVGTPKGLHVLENDEINYVQLKKNATNEQNYITSLKEDFNQNLWIGTYGGLFVIEKNGNQTLQISHPDISEIPEKLINGITENSNKNIFIASNDGLFISSDKTHFKFTKLKVNFKNGIDKNKVSLFNIIDYNNDFMLVNSNIGLLKAEWETSTKLSISPFLNENKKPISSDYVYNSIIDNENNIWVATLGDGAKKYKIENNKLIELDISVINKNQEMPETARSVHQDRQNNIWITSNNGLYKLMVSKNKIFSFPPLHINDCFKNELSIYDIIEDNGGHFWVTTPYELYRFNKDDIMNGICPSNYFYKRDKHTHLSRYLYIDSQNRLWISGGNGLSVSQLDASYNPGKFKQFTKADGLPHNSSFEILEIDQDTFWVTNYAGLVKLSFTSGNLNNPSIKIYESSKQSLNTLVNSYTLELEKDKMGNLWVGTFFGLSKLISEDDLGSFANYINNHKDFNSLSNNSIKRIFKDHSNRLWIGTQTGLNLYNYKTDSFHQFGRTDGLPSEYILGIDEDSKGFLWIATTNGVIKTKYVEDEEKFIDIKHFTTREGLVDNITYLNAIHIDKENNVLIGSRNGISILRHTELKPDYLDYDLALISIENIKKNTSNFSPIKNTLDQHEIELSFQENSIKINYAALDFSRQEFNRYRHKILPLNENWIETGNISELIYYNLSPGDYDVFLDGSNNQESWSDAPLHLHFTIKPPFWKSNTALILYALLGGILVRISYLLRIKKRVRELEQETILEKALTKEREQLRQENTADFHDELGSKVTKISLFLALAERSLKDKKDPSEWFVKIRNNVKDLSGGFRDLLWVIDPQKDSFSDAILRLKDFGEDLFNNTDIDFRTHGYAINLTQIVLDPKTKKQIVMIFKEAMNNCAKYANCKNVNLNINSNALFSSIALIDDGIGFNVEKKSKGRGLKNIVNRAKKINAILTITSNENGTQLVLDRIPHLSDNLNLEES